MSNPCRDCGQENWRLGQHDRVCLSCGKTHGRQSYTPLDHPCKETCSGWQQGFEKGKASSVLPPDADLEKVISEEARTAVKGLRNETHINLFKNGFVDGMRKAFSLRTSEIEKLKQELGWLTLERNGWKKDFEELQAERRTHEHKTAHVRGYGPIPWSVHQRAWEAYAAKFGKQQSAERIVERGGFSELEMDLFYPAWRIESSEIASLKKELSESEKLAPGIEWAFEFLMINAGSYCNCKNIDGDQCDKHAQTFSAHQFRNEALRQGIKLKEKG